MIAFVNTVSAFAVPAILFLILTYGIYKKVHIYECFMEGATDGIKIVFDIFAPILGILVAINMFRASGALEILTSAFAPIAERIHFPTEMLPFAILRPISGGGSLALATDIFKTYGTDSFVGRATSTLMGSTETTFYTLTVYFGAIGIKNIKYSLKCALFADLVGMFVSVWVCYLIFGG